MSARIVFVILATLLAGCSVRPIKEQPRAVPRETRVEIESADANVNCFLTIANQRKLQSIGVELDLRGYTIPISDGTGRLIPDGQSMVELVLVGLHPYYVHIPRLDDSKQIARYRLRIALLDESKGVAASAMSGGMDVLFGGGRGEGDAAMDRTTSITTDQITIGAFLLDNQTQTVIDRDWSVRVVSSFDRTTQTRDVSFSLGTAGAGKTIVVRTAQSQGLAVQDATQVALIALLAKVHGIDLSTCLNMPRTMNRGDVAGYRQLPHPVSLHDAIALVMSANTQIYKADRITVGDSIYLPATVMVPARAIRVRPGDTLSKLVLAHYFSGKTR